jgi:hypothetical protein
LNRPAEVHLLRPPTRRRSFVRAFSFASILAAVPGTARAADWCPGFGPFGFDEPVWSAVVFEGDLVVTGGFSANGSTALPRVARWDGTRWLAMGDPADQWGLVEVLSACVYNGELYIGGRRYESDAMLLRWNRTDWGLVDQPLGFTGDGQITAMVVHDGKLFLAGDLVGTATEDFGGSVVAWDGTDWVTLNDPPDMGGSLFQGADLVEYRGDLYVTGRFAAAGGAPPLTAWRAGTVSSGPP